MVARLVGLDGGGGIAGRELRPRDRMARSRRGRRAGTARATTTIAHDRRRRRCRLLPVVVVTVPPDEAPSQQRRRARRVCPIEHARRVLRAAIRTARPIGAVQRPRGGIVRRHGIAAEDIDDIEIRVGIARRVGLGVGADTVLRRVRRE